MAVLVAAIFLLVLEATVTHQRNRSTLQVHASVAVLPFVNPNGDSSDVHLREGLADELIGTLQQLQGVRVAPRTSALVLRKRDLPEGHR